MEYLNKNNIQNFSDMIVNLPILSKLKTKDQLKNVLEEYFDNIYKKIPIDIENFFNYEVSENYTNLLLNTYGIETPYFKNINKILKRKLIYNIEKIYENKGSSIVLNEFSNLFKSFFGEMNFYRIVVDKELHTNNSGEKEYRLIYKLEPYIINDKTNMLKNFDNKISKTKKHLMSLYQYNDFNVFPTYTNLIYIQFLNASSSYDNDNYFNQAIRIIARTLLNKESIHINNFYNLPSFNFNLSDIEYILFYCQMTLLRKDSPNYNFNYKNKLGYSYIVDDYTCDSIQELLLEYKKIRHNDRKTVKSLHRRWKMIMAPYNKTNHLFHNYDQFKDFLHNKYPDLIEKIDNILNGNEETKITNFYIEFYQYILSFLENDNEYILIYLNYIFLQVITGDDFVNNFFLPTFLLFQQYFFQAEMDFVNSFAQKIVIKDKFESCPTEQIVRTFIDMKGILEKHRELYRPEIIKVFLLWLRKDDIPTSDEQHITINRFQNDHVKLYSRFKTFITSRVSTQYNMNDKTSTNTKTIERNNLSFLDKEHLKLYNKSKDTLAYDNFFKTNISTKYQNIVIKNDIKYTKLSSGFLDVFSINDRFLSIQNRYNYFQLNELTLKNYEIFYYEQYRKESSFIDNLNYKYINKNDELYFSFFNLF